MAVGCGLELRGGGGGIGYGNECAGGNAKSRGERAQLAWMSATQRAAAQRCNGLDAKAEQTIHSKAAVHHNNNNHHNHHNHHPPLFVVEAALTSALFPSSHDDALERGWGAEKAGTHRNDVN